MRPKRIANSGSASVNRPRMKGREPRGRALRRRESKKGWHYSFLTGIWYDNVPVGIIAAGCFFALYIVVTMNG